MRQECCCCDVRPTLFDYVAVVCRGVLKTWISRHVNDVPFVIRSIRRRGETQEAADNGSHNTLYYVVLYNCFIVSAEIRCQCRERMRSILCSRVMTLCSYWQQSSCLKWRWPKTSRGYEEKLLHCQYGANGLHYSAKCQRSLYSANVWSVGNRTCGAQSFLWLACDGLTIDYSTRENEKKYDTRLAAYGFN